MKKKELLNLPEINITKEIINIAMNDKPVKKIEYGRSHYVYAYKDYYKAKVFDGILKVAIFTRDDLIRKKPSYEIYISKEENKYLTYDTKENKWRTAKIDNLDPCYSYYEDKRYYCKGTQKTIIDYLDNDKKRGYEAILSFQLEIKADSLQRMHNRITKKIDSAMELVSKLPSDFDSWIENTAMIHSRYIYYVYSRTVKEGYCTHCNQMVPIKSPKHNTEGTCKKCRSHITFKAVKKAAVVRDEGYASIYQKTREGFVFRYFEISKKYSNYLDPTISTTETIRILFDNNLSVVGEYEWAEFKNSGIIRWCVREEKAYAYSYYRSNTGYMHKSTLYHRNLNKVFKGTEFQYSAIDIFAKGLKGGWFYPGTYLSEYKKHKFLEYLVKLKLYHIVSGYLGGYDNYLNKNGHRIHEVLKVSKEQVKQLSEMNATYTELRVLQRANETGVKLTSAQLRWIAENLGISSLIDYMRYSTPHKVIRYLKDQSLKTNIELKSIVRDYVDYLENVEKLGYNINDDFIFFPRNLKEAHDLAVEEWKQKKEAIEKMKDDERNIEMAKIAEELIQKYAMKDKHYSIRIPWTCEEIRNEGHELHHCVGTYINKVISRGTIILFIRKITNIDKSFYTMEIRHNEIIQVRGKNNCDTTPEVQAFVDKFERKKLQEHPVKEAV